MTELSPLQGKRGLIVGIANDKSIAYGCATALAAAGAELAITYLNDKAKPHVEPLAQTLKADIFLPLDVLNAQQMDDLFLAIQRQWGGLDFVVHAIAYAPTDDLHKPISQCSRAGFLQAMEISCYSLIDIANRAAPLMTNGGCILTATYYGGEKVVPQYNVMGPVKAALDGIVKYLAADLGPRAIRVNAVSPGPIATRAASGIAEFSNLLTEAERVAPLHENVNIADVGAFAAFLIGDEAKHITGNIAYIDSGFHVVA